MLDDVNFSSDERQRVLAFDWSSVRKEHFMQCYEEDESLVQAVSLFMHKSLAGNDAAIVIATGEHRTGIERVLAAKGLDPAKLQRQGRYIPLDAAETLESIMVGGQPDRRKFFEVIGMLVSCASNSWGGVRAFGEMVNLLWAEGKRSEALELERLWNELAKIYPFALFCAYSKDAFDSDGDEECFSQVCEAHSMVIL